MVLLTSSQVSVAISSGVIFIFTFALFIAGYVMQQQTVKHMQRQIIPTLPRPKTTKAAPDATAFSSVMVSDDSATYLETSDEADYGPQRNTVLRQWIPESSEEELWTSRDTEGTLLVKEP